MKILDLDLDFFLDTVPYNSDMEGSSRLNSDEYKPWKPDMVINFLEQNCGLSVSNPVRGYVINSHEKAFYIWRNLIEINKLRPPFDIVHIDSHADLGCGDGSFIYIMTELLHKPVSERKYPKNGINGINCGSYLAFVAATRWLNSLTFVTHPYGNNDVMRWHLKDLEEDAKFIQLKKCDPTRFDSTGRSMDSIGVISTEPEVPFQKVDWQKFKEQIRYDFVMFCVSPTFTPIESDSLIPIIERYIDTY